MTVAVPALLAGLAVAVLMVAAPVPSRLSAVLPGGTPPTDRTPASRDSDRPPSAGRGGAAAAPAVPTRGPLAACVLAGLALALLVGGPAGLVAGALVAAAGPRALSRLEPRELREQRERYAADLPLALDLLAACLTGGAPLLEAVRAVGEAVSGPCGSRMSRVAAALEAGSPPHQAWQVLSEDTQDDLARSAVRALSRAGDGGAPVATAVARLASEARDAAAARGREAAERAGVLAVAPLGLCFLPAFVLLGVVPVVAGLVAPLLSGL